MGDNNKDLEDLAKSTSEDLYALLNIDFDADEAAIKKAYRKVALTAHPDKHPDDPNAADRFIFLGWAADILKDAKLKGEYDRARTRRREKAAQEELLSGQRRRMKEDLERREHAGRDPAQGFKRRRPEDMSESEKKEQELERLVHRLAEDGAKRRKEMTERRMKEHTQAMEAQKAAEPQSAKPGNTADLDRSVKIRFAREGTMVNWDEDKIKSIFARYGQIDSVVIMGKEKKMHVSGEKHRKLIATAYIIYTRPHEAHFAIGQATHSLPFLESVSWGKGGPEMPTAPTERPTIPTRKENPSLEEVAQLREITIMRLREAEKRRLEKPIFV